MSRSCCVNSMCRGALLFAASLLITGCVATADFVDLTKEVTYVRNQQNELKAQVAELKTVAADIAAQQNEERPEYLGSRLDVLSTRFEAMEVVQSVLGSQLIDLRRDHEEGMRRIASIAAGVETASDPGAGTTPCASSDMPEMEPEIQAVVPSDGTTQDQTELSPREAFEVAYQDYQAGDYDGAIQGFKAFQQRFPDASLAVDAQYLVGTSYFRTRDCVKAIAAYEKMVNTFPHHRNNVLGLLKLSYLYDAMGNAAQARSVLIRLIERHPRSKEAKLARQRLPNVSQ
ncbi:MAG TPA: tol-pal system protein YbgF [Nitrospirales bacterium]|nr:tol-pal system protein YbgF [Nitrospirales bacterium]